MKVKFATRELPHRMGVIHPEHPSKHDEKGSMCRHVRHTGNVE